MEPIKIQVELTVNEKTEAILNKLITFFSGLRSDAKVENTAENKKEQVAVKAQPAETKAQPAETKVRPAETKAQPAETKAQPAETKAQPVANASSSEKKPSITDIRKALVSKVNEHREVIKEKLNSFGVQNVTALQEDNYTEFYQFLTSL